MTPAQQARIDALVDSPEVEAAWAVVQFLAWCFDRQEDEDDIAYRKRLADAHLCESCGTPDGEEHAAHCYVAGDR